MLKDIIIPLIIAAIAIGILSSLINTLLRLIRLDFGIFKLALFLVAWYFIGPIIYNFLLDRIIVNQNDIMIFIYTPVQTVMNYLGL